MPPHEHAVLPEGIWEQVLLPVLVADGSTNTANSGDGDTPFSSISQEAVCQLLCSSKAISRAVRSECSGQLCANFSARSLQQAQHFASWLTRNGSLVKQLQFSFHKRWVDGKAFQAGAATIVACAVSTAASRGTLQHLESVVDRMPSPMMLNALSGISSLTSLKLDFSRVEDWYPSFSPAAYNSDYDDDDDEGGGIVRGAEQDQLTQSLSRLTQLRELSLNWPCSGSNPLWAPLPALAQLTALTVICQDLQHDPSRFNPRLLPQGPTNLQKLALVPHHARSSRSWLQPHSADMQYLASVHNLTVLTELRAPGSCLSAPIKMLNLLGNPDAVPGM
jgi:hypothetical protein